VRGSLADSSYPAFMDLVKRQLREDYKDEDLTSEGLRIFTSFDPLLQMKAEKAIADSLKGLGDRANEMEAAMVVTGAQTGEILALVGGRNPRFSGFNRARDASGPSGSLVKPAVYLTDLEQRRRYSLITPVEDAPISLDGEPGKTWSPQNYSRQSYGIVPLHQALAQSYNQATVRVGVDVGVERGLNTIEPMGVRHGRPAYQARRPGAGAMSPLQGDSLDTAM